MTQKERFVELYVNYYILQDEHKQFWLEDNRVDEYLKPVAEKIADYFLQNGVIVPPCKVGDAVFKIAEVCRLGLNPYSFYCEECLYHPFYSGSTEDRCECHYEIQKVIAKTKSWIVRNLVDSDKQRYWLTQEEAEQALKERDIK